MIVHLLVWMCVCACERVHLYARDYVCSLNAHTNVDLGPVQQMPEQLHSA